MELIEILDILQDFILDKKMKESLVYQEHMNKISLLSQKLEKTIDLVSDLKLRRSLKNIFTDYQDSESDRVGFEVLFAYKHGAIVGEAFSILKQMQ